MRVEIRTAIAAAGILVGLSSGADAQTTLAQWNVQNFTSVPFSATPVSQFVTPTTGYTAGSLSRGTGFTNPGGTNGFYATDIDAATVAQANSLSEFFSFTVTANAQRALVLSSLVFTDVVDGTGPTRVAVRSSQDNFAADIPLNTVLTNTGGVTHTATLTNLATTDGGSLTFRLYAYAAADPAGTYLLANAPVSLSGSVLSPEPGSVALVLLALPALGLLRRRRK